MKAARIDRYGGADVINVVADADRSHAFEDTVGELDAVLDPVGGDMATKSYSVIRDRGVLGVDGRTAG